MYNPEWEEAGKQMLEKIKAKEAGNEVPVLQTTATHIYDWLNLPASDDAERLAKEWLTYYCAARPETTGKEIAEFDCKRIEWLNAHPLFCTYKGQKHRVTGASRLGDVWLNSNFDKRTGYSSGYERRVDVTECSDWERIDATVSGE